MLVIKENIISYWNLGSSNYIGKILPNINPPENKNGCNTTNIVVILPRGNSKKKKKSLNPWNKRKIALLRKPKHCVLSK